MDDTIPFIKLVDGSSRNKKHEGDEAKVREGLMQPVCFPCFATCPSEGQDYYWDYVSGLSKKPCACYVTRKPELSHRIITSPELPYRQAVDHARNGHLAWG